MKRRRNEYEQSNVAVANAADEQAYNNFDGNDYANDDNMALVDEQQQQEDYNDTSAYNEADSNFNDNSNFNMFAYSSDLVFQDENNHQEPTTYNDPELDQLQQSYFQDDYYSGSQSKSKFF